MIARSFSKPLRGLFWSVLMVAILLGLNALLHPNRLVKQASSPDENYRANLMWESAIAYGGHGHIVLETTGWHLFGYGRSEIAQVEEFGLVGIRWLDNTTLCITYDAKKRDGYADYENTVFVQQKVRWRDVKIIYQGVQEP